MSVTRNYTIWSASFFVFLLALYAPSGSAALIAYEVRYDGVLGSSATGFGLLVVDGDVFAPIGDVLASPEELGIVDFELVIEGASTGNGRFSLADFPRFAVDVGAGLDLSNELIGQPAFISFNPCGDEDDVCSPGELVESPRGFDVNLIITQGGSGDRLRLVSLSPTSVALPSSLYLFVVGALSMLHFQNRSLCIRQRPGRIQRNLKCLI